MKTFQKIASTMALFAMMLGVGVTDVFAGFGTLSDGTNTKLTVTLTNYNVSAAPGETVVTFGADTEIPVGGQIQITLPDTFTAPNNATPAVILGVAGGATIASQNLTEKVITITTAGAVIAATDDVTITIPTGVITANPTIAGSYGFQVTTRNASGVVLDTGMAMVNIGDAGATTDGDQVSITATVQEAMVMTITAGDVLNFIVNPSVNNGIDASQSTTLNVRTNASNYQIEVALSKDDQSPGTSALLKSGTTTFAAATGISGEVLGAGAATGENYLNFFNDDATPARTAFGANGAGVNIFTGAQTGRTNSADHTVDYELNVDYTVEAGEYTGTITYTAVPTF